MISIIDPPAIWLSAPPPPIAELHYPLESVDRICRAMGASDAGTHIYGCMAWGYGACVIILPKIDFGFDLSDQDRVRRHETAHCNGWKHEH